MCNQTVIKGRTLNDKIELCLSMPIPIYLLVVNFLQCLSNYASSKQR